MTGTSVMKQLKKGQLKERELKRKIDKKKDIKRLKDRLKERYYTETSQDWTF